MDRSTPERMTADRMTANRTSLVGASLPLRTVLIADAALCAGSGQMLALGAGQLADWFGLPSALLRGCGLFLLPFAACLAFVGTRQFPRRSAILAIAAANLLWVLGSVGLLLSGQVEPAVLGYVFVIAQAVAVFVFVARYVAALRFGRPALD